MTRQNVCADKPIRTDVPLLNELLFNAVSGEPTEMYDGPTISTNTSLPCKLCIVKYTTIQGRLYSDLKVFSRIPYS